MHRDGSVNTNEHEISSSTISQLGDKFHNNNNKSADFTHHSIFLFFFIMYQPLASHQIKEFNSARKKAKIHHSWSFFSLVITLYWTLSILSGLFTLSRAQSLSLVCCTACLPLCIQTSFVPEIVMMYYVWCAHTNLLPLPATALTVNYHYWIVTATHSSTRTSYHRVFCLPRLNNNKFSLKKKLTRKTKLILIYHF